MAGFSKTYSGDFTSFVAGKIVGAAGLAKGEKDRRVAEGLERARSGSLFARALQHEFGGDLYNRTLGNIDPRKKFAETDRKSSKEGRFTGQFPEGKGKSGSSVDKEVESAKDELLKEDDSIPVKDEKLRTQVSKFLGTEIATKMNVVNYATNEVVKEVKGVRSDLDKTHSLISHQTDILSEKFDVILGIFDANLAYQKKIAEEAKVRRREAELEQEKDLSSTRAIEEAFGGKKGDLSTALLRKILGFASKGLLKKLTGKNIKAASAVKDLLDIFGSKGGRKGISKIGSRFLRTILREKDPLKRGKITKILSGRGSKAEIARFLNVEGLSELDFRKINRSALTSQRGPKAPRVGSKFEAAGADALRDIAADADFMSGAARQQATTLDKMLDGGRKGVTKKGKAKLGRETLERVTQKSGGEIAEKLGKKAATKAASKSLKFVPGVGTVIALGEAAFRAAEGDWTGAALSALSAIPIAGWAFTAVDIARDMGVNPLGLPAAGPSMFETGTGLARKGPAVLHGTEMVVGSKDREDALNSYSEAVQKQTDMLVSSAISLGNATGFGPEVNSEIKKLGVKYTFVRMPVDTDIGNARVAKGPDVIPAVRLFDLQTREEKEEKKKPETEDDKDDSSTPSTSTPSTTTPVTNGSYASGTWIGPTGDRDGEQTGLNMNLPGGIGTPIYAPVDLIYRSKGTDGNPAVGLQGDADAKGPAGRGFGYYGAYYFEKDGKEYEVLMGHFRDLPLKGNSEGQVIPKGTLLGYQGASGRSVSKDNGIYPHISLHVNGIGFIAGNDVLKWFADGLASGKSSSGPTGKGYGKGGGERAKAFHELAKDEALSSLTPGVNDYVKPGGFSVISNTPWDTITDNTLLYPYDDGTGVATIGYGSAQMRGITFGTNPIPVRQAKAWLKDDISRISNNLSKNIKWWDSMTDDQKAGLIMFEYNAGEGNSYISSKGYPSLVRALEEGNIRAAIEEIQRTGPAQSRIDVEQNLLRSGPQQIVGPKIVGPEIVGEGKVGSGIPFFPDLTIMKGIQGGLQRSSEREKNSELLKLLPVLNNKSRDLQSNSSLMEDVEEKMVVQTIIMNNTTTVASRSTNITSNIKTDNNSLKDYQMAVLGS